jgi:hypothetical protein
MVKTAQEREREREKKWRYVTVKAGKKSNVGHNMPPK